MQAAEQVTQCWGFDCTVLNVYQRNKPAIALYKRCGYKVVDENNSLLDAVQGKQSFLMVKRLNR